MLRLFYYDILQDQQLDNCHCWIVTFVAGLWTDEMEDLPLDLWFIDCRWTFKEIYEVFETGHQNEKMSLKLLFVSLKVIFVFIYRW